MSAAGQPPRPDGVAVVHEVRAEGPVPLWRQPAWAETLPWLVQGTTGAGDGPEPFDLGLFGEAPVGPVLERWRVLREAVGMERAAHAHQIHQARILTHNGGPPGLHVAHGYDGHVTDRAGVLLAVSVADCVPVFVVDPERRRIALVHAGWRGTAAGIVGRAIERLAEEDGDAPGRLHVHMGPAICGACYEVGPEVFEALGERAPEAPAPIDLRAVLARRAVRAGVGVDRLTISTHCTRCTGSELFSHRGGDPHRQVGYIGLVPGSA